jgi:hypothetical protein
MAKTKDKDKIEVVRINESEDGQTEEVFLYREEPYVNEVKYAPKGVYKLGAFTEDTIEKKEELLEDKK